MSRSLKLIAAQAVVVGSLLIVVSLTLLGPEAGDSLFDVVAPGDDAEISDRDGARDEGARDPGAGPEARSGGEPAAGPRSRPGGAVPGASSPPAEPAPLPAPAPVPPEVAGDDPAADQYADAVARLSQQLE